MVKQLPLAKGIFFTDFDGTLLTSDKTISKEDRSALEELGNAGCVRVIATGRSLYSFMQACPASLPIDYIIFSTGAGIASFPDPYANILRANTLESEKTQRVAELFNRMDLDYMIHHPIPDNHCFLYSGCGIRNTDFQSRINSYNGFAEKITCHTNLNRPSSQLLAVIPSGGNGEPDTGIIDAIGRALPDLSVIRATSPIDGTSAWVEVFSPESSKSQAASWLANRLDIPREHTVATGNDYNDADLLSWAGIGTVVSNAPEDLKARFTQVASHNENGVSQAAALYLNRMA